MGFVHLKKADYFTDDKEDAVETAHAELNRIIGEGV